MGSCKYELILVLSTCKVKIGKDVLSRRLTLEQATDRRDALAKVMYTILFEWLVERINLSLAMDKQDSWRSISILDISGFDISENNSFEQFCINYANERLQQHFNRHIFKLEQEEYELDGVHWTKIDFKDNKDCLDLFERKQKQAGLISILDEITSLKKATKSTLTTKLRQELSAHHCFKGEKDGTFRVSHFAGEALYDASDFLEKNRDPLYPEAVHLLSSSAHELPRCFSSRLLKQLECMGRTSLQSEMPACQNQSLVSKLQVQLLELFQHLDCTEPHFIYCIRPNSKQIPGLLEPNLVLGQLRSCNILEVLRISKFGYPAKATHQDFTRRYEILLPENIAERDPLSMSIAILQHIGIRPEMYQVGYTKLYFRAGQIDVLEDAREKAVQGTLELQKYYGCHRVCRNFHELKEAVTALQSYVRGEIARKKFIRDGSVHNNSASYHKAPNASIFEELRTRVLMAEAALVQKEKENKAFSEQVEELESRWPQYEAKMKSMEEMWQKQMQSLQMKLATATKELEASNSRAQPLRANGAQSPRSFNSEETSMGSLTPGCGTPTRCIDSSMDERGTTSTSVIVPLVKEFEQQKQLFDREAQAMISGGQSPIVNPMESVRSLNRRFEEWKKRFRSKLREAKVKARKMGEAESDKNRWKWWGLKSRR